MAPHVSTTSLFTQAQLLRFLLLNLDCSPGDNRTAEMFFFKVGFDLSANQKVTAAS